MTARYEDPLHNSALFDIELPPPIALADKFVVPPMSVLDRRSGDWRDRRQKWLSLGIKSEVGRARESGAYATLSDPKRNDFMSRLLRGEVEPNPHGGGSYKGMIQQAGGISVFDPVVCELVYRWFSPVGGTILDPFAGGSVRGVVASHLQRNYVGIDLREEQVHANADQLDICDPDHHPVWLCHDSARMDEILSDDSDVDLIFTCPPYGNLEVYSNAPEDLSTMRHSLFLETYGQIIDLAVRRLRPDRFAAIVVADFRDARGIYRNFVSDTIEAFENAGARLYNDAIIIDPIGSAAMRAERQFTATRKLAKVHQNLLVFVKGDPKRATWDCGGGLGRAPEERDADITALEAGAPLEEAA